MKVMIACGGTGGHLFPGMAVAEVLHARRHRVRLLVSEKAIDQAALAVSTGCSNRSDGIAMEAVPAVGYEGAGQLIRFCLRLARATRGCVAACDEFGPDVVLGMGGFTSAPAIFGARWFRKRGTATLIHESNAVPGKANRWAGRLADHVAVGTGRLRPVFWAQAGDGHGHADSRSVAARQSGRRARTTWFGDGTIDGVGRGRQPGSPRDQRKCGSGAAVAGVAASALQFVHLTGAKDEEFMRDTYEKSGFRATVMSFCGQMELAYSAADVVVARSGAATLTEVAAFGLPAILVPYPHAAGNHQWYNARVFERAGAAWLIEQSSSDGEVAERGECFARVIGDLLDDEPRRRSMAAAARSLAVDDAADRIAALLEQYGKQATTN